jgi:NAD(P)-dependent dehydrogenase (short-subunit alcohol dehydrogenase family)
MNSIQTERKVAVISGGTGYVGSKVAERLSEEGFIIALLCHRSGEEVVEAIIKRLSGDGHKAYNCDLSDTHQVVSLFQSIEKDLGNVGLCVHAAGKKPERKKLHTTTLDEARDQLENNVITSFNFLTIAARILKEHKEGVIIGVTTIGVIKSEATKSLGAYIPAKYAVQGMLTMLRDELSPYNVSVYSLAPGFMREGMNADIPSAFVQMVQEKSASKKLATAEDVAETVVRLYKKDSSTQGDLTISIAPEYL